MTDYQKENDKILAEYKSEAAKNHEEFIADGLMFCGKVVDKGGYWERIRGNENVLYEKMSPKILLLTKDFPDDGGTEDIRIENFRINGKVEPETSGRRFHQNVMAHVWGLTHYMPDKGRCPKWSDEDFPWSWDDAREFYETNPIVRINMKKVPGKSSIDDKTLIGYMYNEKYRPILIKQIKLFNPDIIVCYSGAIFDFVINPANGIIKDVNKTSGWAYYSPIHKKIIINSYHPSYFGIKEETFYTDMMNSYEKILNEHPELANVWFPNKKDKV